jgi:hypothetical protein
MDRGAEDLQFLGIVGIVGEAFKILRSFAKLLGAVTLSLILPLCFSILGNERITREFTWEQTEFFTFLAAYVVFVLAFSLLSTAAVVYTVASIYTGKEISYARVMSILPRVWKRLMVTFLWFFIILFAYCTAFIFVIFLLIFMAKGNKLNLAVFLFGLILITANFCGYVYISMVWHLACVISVLEDKYGLGAMRKSKDLIKGNRITALELYIVYLIFGGIIGWYFTFDVLQGHRHGVGSAGRAAYGVLLVGLLCFVNLMWLLTQSVFYFVCKSYHHESIDKSSLSDHLEIYHGDYEPLKNSNIQLEDLYASV